MENPSEQCASGATPEKLFMYPPIRSGCLCRDGTVHSHAYCFVQEKCTYVKSKEAKPLFYFRKAKLCVKRYEKSQFRIKSEAECPAEYSEACGSLVCLHNSLGTNGINVLTTIREAAADSLTDKSFDQSDPSRKKYKFDLTCPDDSVRDIIAVQVGVGNAPCSSNRKPGKLGKSYPLSLLKFDGCGESGV